MHFFNRRRETPEEARQRRLCRLMLELPPEPLYDDVPTGVAAVAGLCVALLVVVAWSLGYLPTLAPVLVSGALLSLLTPTVLMIRRRYRHVVAAAFLLAVLLGMLTAAVRRYGDPATVALVIGPTPSAIADAVAQR